MRAGKKLSCAPRLHSTKKPTIWLFLRSVSARQLPSISICRAIEEALAKAKAKPLAVEGFTHGQWVLIDCGDVVIHVFYETARQFYNIEGLWGQAPRRQLPEPYHTQSQHLRIANA
jgi:ribosome silencing factor RsfS/YbeB/iojap